MATKRTPGSRSGLIRCEFCGEEYSASYRRCPVCEERDLYDDEYDEYDDDRSARGGKRLAPSQSRGGGARRIPVFRIVSTIVSLAVICAAIWIVVTKVMPLVRRGDTGTVDPDAAPSASQGAHTQPSGDPSPGASPNAGAPVSAPPDTSPDPSAPAVSPSAAPSPAPTPSATPRPTPAPSTAPSSSSSVTFTLNRKEFSFSDRYPDPVKLKVTFSPATASGTLTWTSSDTSVATVDETGTVRHGTKHGSATITATLDNGVSQTCKVYNQIESTASGSSGETGTGQGGTTSTGSYTVNNPDFTFYRQGETYRLRVKDYSGSVTWTSSDTSVATVASDGTCTAVSSGKCTVTGTLDNGATVKAIVRVDL